MAEGDSVGESGLIKRIRRVDSYLMPLAVLALAVSARHNWRAGRRAVELGAAGSGRGRSAGVAPRIARVSALVAAWNESATVAQHINSFLALSHPDKQLVLCAGGDDGTYEIAQELARPEVVVLEQRPGEGKQRALQRCLEASDGEIIVLSDADCLFTDVALERLIRPLVNREADVTTGFREPLEEQRASWFVRFQWCSEAATEDRGLHAAGLWGGNCATRRELIERAGAFRERAETGTDYVQGRLLLRAGYPIRWIPDSQLQTRYPADVSRYVRTWRRWIKNILIHGPKYRDWRGMRETLAAVGLAAGTLLLPLLWPVAGRIALVGPLTSLTVATMNRVRRIAVGGRLAGLEKPSWRLYAAAPFFAVLDQVATLLAAVDLLSSKGRKRW